MCRSLKSINTMIINNNNNNIGPIDLTTIEVSDIPTNLESFIFFHILNITNDEQCRKIIKIAQKRLLFCKS